MPPDHRGSVNRISRIVTTFPATCPDDRPWTGRPARHRAARAGPDPRAPAAGAPGRRVAEGPAAARCRGPDAPGRERRGHDRRRLPARLMRRPPTILCSATRPNLHKIRNRPSRNIRRLWKPTPRRNPWKRGLRASTSRWATCRTRFATRRKSPMAPVRTCISWRTWPAFSPVAAKAKRPWPCSIGRLNRTPRPARLTFQKDSSCWTSSVRQRQKRRCGPALHDRRRLQSGTITWGACSSNRGKLKRRWRASSVPSALMHPLNRPI